MIEILPRVLNMVCMFMFSFIEENYLVIIIVIDVLPSRSWMLNVHAGANFDEIIMH